MCDVLCEQAGPFAVREGLVCEERGKKQDESQERRGRFLLEALPGRAGF